MTLDISGQELAMYYTKAREKYYECINNGDNAFLKEEISVPFKIISLMNSDVKVVFTRENTEEYLLEIAITLWDESNQIIGKYVYVEDDKGNAVDDSLVFF